MFVILLLLLPSYLKGSRRAAICRRRPSSSFCQREGQLASSSRGALIAEADGSY
jgi:hypothetical protein